MRLKVKHADGCIASHPITATASAQKIGEYYFHVPAHRLGIAHGDPMPLLPTLYDHIPEFPKRIEVELRVRIRR
jgi:hypothetical protein